MQVKENGTLLLDAAGEKPLEYSRAVVQQLANGKARLLFYGENNVLTDELVNADLSIYEPVGGAWTFEAGPDEVAQAAQKLAMLLAPTLPDTQALEVRALYSTWEALVAKKAAATPGLRFQYAGGLWKVSEGQEHTFSAQWKPDEAHSLYSRIDEAHSGKTPAEAIPFFANMEVFKELYYTDPAVPGAIYRCTRDSGQPLQHPPNQLVGHYFEIVEGEA